MGMLDTNQQGSHAAKAMTRLLEAEREGNQAAKVAIRLITQLEGSTKSTAQVGDATRSLSMLETESKGSQIGINTSIAVNTLKMKLFMYPLFGLDAPLDMSHTQVSLQNWVGSNCNSNNLAGRKRRQFLEEILSEA